MVLTLSPENKQKMKMDCCFNTFFQYGGGLLVIHFMTLTSFVYVEFVEDAIQTLVSNIQFTNVMLSRSFPNNIFFIETTTTFTGHF